MNEGFIVSYIVVPIIISVGIIRGREKKLNSSLAKMVMIKGIFYIYLALSTLYLYYTKASDRYAVGFTIALAIIEGVSSVYDGISIIKRDKEMQ